MKILSIDQSYTSTGYCLFNDNEFLTAGLFTSNKEQDIFDRAKHIANQLAEMAIEHRPDIVALEGLAFGMMGNATRDLAGLQFTIVNLMRQYRYRTLIIAPNSVKKVATGKGNSKKVELYEKLPQEMKDYFLNTLKAKKSKGLFDLTDAYWIGRATIEHVKGI